MGVRMHVLIPVPSLLMLFISHLISHPSKSLESQQWLTCRIEALKVGCSQAMIDSNDVSVVSSDEQDWAQLNVSYVPSVRALALRLSQRLFQQIDKECQTLVCVIETQSKFIAQQLICFFRFSFCRSFALSLQFLLVLVQSFTPFHTISKIQLSLNFSSFL